VPDIRPAISVSKNRAIRPNTAEWRRIEIDRPVSTVTITTVHDHSAYGQNCRLSGEAMSQGYPQEPQVPQDVPGKKIAAGICAILLGSFGIHKFILGMTTPGIIMLLVTVLTCGVGGAVMWVIGIIEGIIYLTKSDEQFYQDYIVNKKDWF
jgi:TM2 domain-containing membrane protein YozV